MRRFQLESQVTHHLGPRREAGLKYSGADINGARLDIVKARQTCLVDNQAALSQLTRHDHRSDRNRVAADPDNPSRGIVPQLERGSNRVGSLTWFCLVCGQLDSAFFHKIDIEDRCVFWCMMDCQLKAIGQEVPKHRLNLRSLAILQLWEGVERSSRGQSCLNVKCLLSHPVRTA